MDLPAFTLGIEEEFQVVDDLGVRSELGTLREIVAAGTGADRQLRVFERTGDFHQVVDCILGETEHGLPLDRTDTLSSS